MVLNEQWRMVKTIKKPKLINIRNTYTNPKSVYMDKEYIKAKQREVGNIEYVFKNGKWVQVN